MFSLILNFHFAIFCFRCKQCEPCCRDDCSECVHCKDMPKFGGVGKMKQCCLTKQCIAPILPSTASCQVCSKKKGSRKLSQLKPEEILYECERCMEIHHLPCFHVRCENEQFLFLVSHQLFLTFLFAECSSGFFDQ